MIATARDAARLVLLSATLPRTVSAVLATPYVYLNNGLTEIERTLTVAIAEELAAKDDVRDKVIRRS